MMGHKSHGTVLLVHGRSCKEATSTYYRNQTHIWDCLILTLKGALLQLCIIVQPSHTYSSESVAVIQNLLGKGMTTYPDSLMRQILTAMLIAIPVHSYKVLLHLQGVSFLLLLSLRCSLPCKACFSRPSSLLVKHLSLHTYHDLGIWVGTVPTRQLIDIDPGAQKLKAHHRYTSHKVTAQSACII